jgi:hypothetical protein
LERLSRSFYVTAGFLMCFGSQSRKRAALEEDTRDGKMEAVIEILSQTINFKRKRSQERQAAIVTELSADKKTARTFKLSVPGGQ